MPNWVEEQMALLEPPADWVPARKTQRPSRRWIGIAAGILACAIVAVPAQKLWERFTATRVETVRVKTDAKWHEAIHSENLPGSATAPEPARDLDEATRRLGFRPRLPRAGIFASAPTLMTMGEFGLRITINAAALRRQVPSDVTVPPEWEGASIQIRQHGASMAGYGGDYQVIESAALDITHPASIRLPELTRAVLRASGNSEATATAIAQRVATDPALLLGIDEEDETEIREVDLKWGKGTLLHDLEDGKVVRAALWWRSNGHIFAISGPLNDSLMIAAANSID